MFRIPVPRLGATLLAILLLLPLAARADQIVMKNGDVISGKISQVDGKEVVIKPAYTKKFSVKRSAVASIETESVLQVEMRDGKSFRGRFAGLDEGMQVIELEQQPTPVVIEDLVKATVPQRWYVRESSAEAMLTVNEGNTTSRSQVFQIDTRLRLGEHRQYAQLSTRRDENRGKTTKKQSQASYEYDWLFRRRWYLGATASYERDPIRDLMHRFTFGALVGHDFIDSAHNFLTIKAGAGYTNESLAEESNNGLTGLWELEYRHQFAGSKLEFVHDHDLAYQNYGDNNTIIRSKTGLRMDILWDIYATATYRFNYETEPAPGKFNKDSTLAFGLGARF